MRKRFGEYEKSVSNLMAIQETTLVSQVFHVPHPSPTRTRQYGSLSSFFLLLRIAICEQSLAFFLDVSKIHLFIVFIVYFGGYLSKKKPILVGNSIKIGR